jgi:FemAB-related protein (PEP-CTERM system-associated)
MGLLTLPLVDRSHTASCRSLSVVARDGLSAHLPAWREFARRHGPFSLNRDPTWLLVLAQGREHKPYCIQALRGDQVSGILPLSLVSSRLFGRFLVGLPHVSSGGVDCDDEATATALVDRAMALADELDVDFLELRHERPLAHPGLQRLITDKAHMRLDLPLDSKQLWRQLGGKIRNQLRKAQQFGFRDVWGGVELLDEFYGVYSRRMRDLGTPVDGITLFERILSHFAGSAELIIVRQDARPIAAAMLLHGAGLSEMHRSAALTQFRTTAVNTWLHWHALLRTQARGNGLFDFGRPTLGSSVCTFKERFGAQPHAAAVQHYLRRGSPAQLRRAGGKFDLWIRLWRHLPVCATRWLGPKIASGIP